ncbi:pentapeptide repeat-containing protein [Thalassospiraceae bacterium LMO-SO8]|nr:pentapeptide repeat-containing protein [Alphaproteobacteria bacterium LMO-S08]WND77970.1 pentapeptide repeat-containing protein [Thalassospiraceae bacterium LMO-SO8]
MADTIQTEIIDQDGVAVWNEWRKSTNPEHTDLSGVSLPARYLRSGHFRNTNFEGADLHGADLNNADLTQANLVGANLAGANLQNAKLDGANLDGAVGHGAHFGGASLIGVIFTNANLENAKFGSSDLRNANFRGSKFLGADFNSAKIDVRTLGLGAISKEQRNQISIEDTIVTQEDLEDTNHQSVSDVSIRMAKTAVGPASAILKDLSIPNQFNEEQRSLFLSLRESVLDLEKKLEELSDDNKKVRDHNAVSEQVVASLPIWKQAFLTFVSALSGAAAAEGVSFVAGYSAGFVAGFLHDTFSPEAASCLT